MSSMPSPQKIGSAFSAVRTEFRGVGRSAARAWQGSGRERDLVVQSLKAVFAAVLAWLIAGWWLRAPMAIMAPWLAIVLVQATVYSSVAKAMRIMVSVALGTVIAAVGWFIFHNTVLAMAFTLPVTMILGNWRRFGDEGIYGSTSVLFVLSYGPVTAPTVVHRLSEALLGAVIGIAVNLLLWPPVHLRDSRRAADGVAGEVREILRDTADGLRDGWDTAAADERHKRAMRLFRRWEDLRSASAWADESMRMNPRRRRVRQVVSPLDPKAVDALEGLATRTAAITRTVRDAARTDDIVLTPDGVTLGPYAEFLDVLADAVVGLTGDQTDLQGELERARELHAVLSERLPEAAKEGPRMTALTGSLLAEAGRILDEMETAVSV
jgi:uncharacterized membrane protein YgaE (UPF0421/DUF939 family)